MSGSGSDFGRWLANIETDLKRRIKDCRLYPSYVGKVICNDEEFRLTEIGRRIFDRNAGIEGAQVRSKKVSSASIRHRERGDWRKLYDEKVIVNLGNICKCVFAREEQIVVETLTKDAKVFELNSVTLKRDELQNAIDYVNEGSFADSLLVQKYNVVSKGDFTPKRKLKNFSKILATMGPAFIGRIGHLDIYRSIGVPQSTALLYERRQINVKKTPLNVGFDDYDRPEILSLDEDMYAWSVKDGALARIILEA